MVSLGLSLLVMSWVPIRMSLFGRVVLADAGGLILLGCLLTHLLIPGSI